MTCPKNMDSESNNLCIPEDAFENFQAVSMYQEEEYITLPGKEPGKCKDPDPGELSHLSYDNEVVVTTENEVNSTVNDSTEEIEVGVKQTSVDNTCLKENITLDNEQNRLDQNSEPLNVSRRGRKTKHVSESDTLTASNNSNSNVVQANSLQESPLISSTVPRKRGRKPKPKPVVEPVTPTAYNLEISNISSTPLSSDPENDDAANTIRRKRGRPRKMSVPNEQLNSKSDKDFSGELSGSDNNRPDDLLSPRKSEVLTKIKRGRPKKSLGTNLKNQPQKAIDTPSTNILPSDDLNETESLQSDEKKICQTDSDSKVLNDISTSENDDISLSKLKSMPDTSRPADENISSENDKHKDVTSNSVDNTNFVTPPAIKKAYNRKGKGKPKKDHTRTTEEQQARTFDESVPLVESSTSIDDAQIERVQDIDDDGTEDLSLSKLKALNSESQTKTEIESIKNVEMTSAELVEVSTTGDQDITKTVDECISKKTPTKRNSKMPVMSDFEYNVDSVLENEDNADNSLLVEDTSKRPVRRKIPKLRYHEESDEDPFANVELSDEDDSPKRKKGARYYSDYEYVPGRENKEIDSTDSEVTDRSLKGEFVKQKRKKLRKRSDHQSPRKKKAASDRLSQDLESDDVEVCLKPSIIKANDDSQSQPSKAWSLKSNEFESFLAKKIQGTSLKIKKLSASEPNENKTLEIPVIDLDARKNIEMCTQTNPVFTASKSIQTSPPYDIPMKDNITLTQEQSEKACHFLNSIVKTTSELGTLMKQKSEDFIKKKINTTHVTDTMKMDYCVKKSFLLFKLAKHNLMQMEEDLANQYDEFLKTNNLSACRETPKQLVPSAKPASSDSDCEIVEEPVSNTGTVMKSQEKPKFNLKTVFLNKELSIKIAKKPTENKKLNIKGRHTVWINDTVMVKKVKPTQSFLAQDSRNKKPPDNKITMKMVSDFFKNYYRQKALSVCAPFIATDWLNISRECVCNYFVVEPVQFHNNGNFTRTSEISTTSNASAPETNHVAKHKTNKKFITCPESLFKLCFRIVRNQMHDKCLIEEVNQHVRNELTDGKYEPLTLFRMSLRALTCTADNYMERSPTPLPIIAPKEEFTIPSLKTLCHRRIVILLSNSDDNNNKKPEFVVETRCSIEESDYTYPSFSEYRSISSKVRNDIKSLLSLCVEFIQQQQALELSNNILIPNSLKSLAFEHVKLLIYKDLNVPLFVTSHLNLNERNDGTTIEGLTINSVNTLSEEAFLNLEQSHTDSPDSYDEYLDEFDNDDHYERDLNELDEENQTEPSWACQVQMQEPRSCVNTNNTDDNIEENLPIIAQIKVEPLDDMPEDILDSSAYVKTEPVPGVDEMTVIPEIPPEIKPEVTDNLGPGPIHRENSSSYDCDAFEQFVANSKIMSAIHGEDIFSQSVHRERRQHEPDYEEDDMSMSLLIPQTFEPLSIETAKGTLMKSSSDEDDSKTKKVTGKKKPDKRNKGKQKKSDLKTIAKETPTLAKEKVPTNVVANLTKKMRDKIRQEEKKDDSTDSESESMPLRLRKEKAKQAQANKIKESEIQCNNVDSTDQVEDDANNFSGFTAIDQNEISTYQKYMKFVYEKLIPEKEEQGPSPKNITAKNNKDSPGPCPKNNTARYENDSRELPLIADEPVELLECEPTMPTLDEPRGCRSSRNRKGKNDGRTKEVLKEIENLKEDPQFDGGLLKELLGKKTNLFVNRHGWHCYTVNTGDDKLYQSAYVALEKLPESFVQTYFEYQGITTKSNDDEEIDRLTNLKSLNRSGPSSNKTKFKCKREAKGDRTSEMGSQHDSPAHSDHYDELEPSDDERANAEDEVAPTAAVKSTENSLAKNLLMNDNESDSDSPIAKVKQEPAEGTKRKHAKNKKKEETCVEDNGDLMLTADKMMNKELNLLHAPVVVTESVQDTSSIGPVTRNKQKSASKNQSSASKTKKDDEESSEEEKQWVTTKEKLLKRMGKKDQSSVEDAKRAKLMSAFIERRGGLPDSHMRSRTTRSRRFSKKFLERQKQLRVLSRELFGESSDSYMSNRSQAQASVYKGRRNIRKVIDKKSLARSTVVANMEEFERKRRLNARQTKLRELLGCEEGVNVLVINDEVCLEYDFEENRPVVTVHPFFTKVMKAHQYEGVKFMWDACFESLSEIASGHPGGGCILAHCMGLGKTLQVLALLHTVLTHPGVNMQRVLVCCPLSTVLNWVDEIHKWIGPVTDQIKVFELSKLKKTYERAYQLEDWYNGGGIFIIGYELFRSLTTLDPFLDDVRPTIINKIRTALLDPGPDIIVCDEGHLLKNDCSILAFAMSRVVTKRRIILTGTPMQNNLREYYCMVNFVKPNLLGTYSEYSNRFENPIMNGQHRDSREEDIKLMKARTHILHKVLEGCLQRQEASVLYPYLPKKHEYTVFIPLTACQWDLYKHYLNNYGKQNKQSILKDFHILQKIWSHPQVLHNFQTKARDRDEKNKIKVEKIEDDLATEDQEDIKPNAAEDLWWLEYLDGGNMLETLDSSNKFVVVFRLLEECVALGDKVLIFSTSLFCLDAMEYFLKKINKWSLGQEYYRLDGSVPAEVRQKWCREFNADNNYKTKLFLVSTRAGCLGLNMTAANRVIIMDTSWNPAHDIQSIFRAYRFGQKKDCYIYRLVAMGTMEQKIYERSVTKQAVACRVVDEQQIDRHYNMGELTELYKFDEDGGGVAGGVAAGVRDVALLRVARSAALHAVHEHDSLLRGDAEQGLPEHERDAIWMQFQQEHKHKQIENKLIMNIPNVPNIHLKRLHGHDYALMDGPSEIKTEDTTNDPPPSEPKTKKGKKSAIIKCCIPIQDNQENITKTKKNNEPNIIRPKTETQTETTRNETPNPEPSVSNDKGGDNITEDAMVEKITDILLKHNFHNSKGQTIIATLVRKVRNIVQKGFIDKEDMKDVLTASIAKVLLPNQISLPVVTDIMCESITNTVTQQAEETNKDPETITSDITNTTPVSTHQSKGTEEPEPRAKRRAAIAAEKSIDSLSHDIVINLDDDEWDAGDTDFVPDEKEKPQNSNKFKKSPKNPSKPDIEEKAPQKRNQGLQTVTLEEIRNSLAKRPGPKKPKDRTIKPKTKETNPVPKTVEDNEVIERQIRQKEYSRSISLSDDEELPANNSIVTTEKKPVNSSKKSIEKPTEKPAENPTEDDDVIPLPMSLLKNQNFINIVAHTYLVGNPMLDEDAATLAAQYSTLKALKEAEQTGKDVCSGPIYDIAVKVIGKEVLKKMRSANPKAASSSAEVAATTIQMKEEMLVSQKAFDETSQKNKAKLREDMINEKLASNIPGTSKRAGTPNKPVTQNVDISVTMKPVTSVNHTVVPVGFIKTAAQMAQGQFGQPLMSCERAEPRVECILPDDDDLIISDVRPTRASPAVTPSQPRLAPSSQPTTTPFANATSTFQITTPPRHPAPPPPKPITLNNLIFNKHRANYETQPFKMIVSNGPASTSQPGTPPKIILRPYVSSPQTMPQLNMTATTPSNTPVRLLAAGYRPKVTEQTLPNNSTVFCLDSDDEETITPNPQPSTLPQAPVPVSLTRANAPGMSLPLPTMPNLPVTNTNQTAQTLVLLRQVVTTDGTQKFVLLSNDTISQMNTIHSVPKTSTSDKHSTPKISISDTISIPKTSSSDIHCIPKTSISDIYSFPKTSTSDIISIPKTSTTDIHSTPKISVSDIHSVQKASIMKPPQILNAHLAASSLKAVPNETKLPTNNPEQNTKNKPSCKPGDILRISKTGAIEIINRKETSASPKTSVEIKSVVIPNLPRIAPKPSTSITSTATPVLDKPKPRAKKNTKSASIDLTNLTNESVTVPPKLPSGRPVISASVDLTNVPVEITTSKSAVQKPSISATFDLTSLSSDFAKPAKSTYQNEKKQERKSSLVTSGSSTSKRATSPDNPLSILKDVILIKAAEDPPDTGTTKKPIVVSTEKCNTSNISVEHIVSSDLNNDDTISKSPGVLKLTKVPKDKLPKPIIELAIEKQLQKEALLKKISPLLPVNKSKTKEEKKSRGKNTINIAGTDSGSTKKLLKSASADKSKASSSYSAKSSTSKAMTVDLTDKIPAATSVKIKSESKKRQSSATESTPVKKKRSEPMTLKDFNLDDIDDIIELD